MRLIDSCITRLQAQGFSRTCNESKEEEEEDEERPNRGLRPHHLLEKARSCGEECMLVWCGVVLLCHALIKSVDRCNVGVWILYADASRFHHVLISSLVASTNRCEVAAKNALPCSKARC